MKENAGGRERVAELKPVVMTAWSVYDPAGVGGTCHVRAASCRQAESVSRSAGKPKSAETVKFWKGVWETARAFRFCRDLCRVFHYVGVGPEPCGRKMTACMKRKTVRK